VSAYDTELGRTEIDDFIFRRARFNFDNDEMELPLVEDGDADMIEANDSMDLFCLCWDLAVLCGGGTCSWSCWLVGIGNGQSGG